MSDMPTEGYFTLTDENAVEIALWCGGKVVREKDALDPEIEHVAVNIPVKDGVDRIHVGDRIAFDTEQSYYIKNP
jgi:hypothetical protein